MAHHDPYNPKWTPWIPNSPRRPWPIYGWRPVGFKDHPKYPMMIVGYVPSPEEEDANKVIASLGDGWMPAAKRPKVMPQLAPTPVGIQIRSCARPLVDRRVNVNSSSQHDDKQDASITDKQDTSSSSQHDDKQDASIPDKQDVVDLSNDS